jgi:hypothetical protein
MVWSRPIAQLSPGNHFVPRWRKMMLPGITYCSVGGERVLVLVFLSGFCCFFVLSCVVGRVVVVVEERYREEKGIRV